MIGFRISRHTEVHAFNSGAHGQPLCRIDRFQSQGHEARRPTRLELLWVFTTEQAAGGFVSKGRLASAASLAGPNPSIERTSTGLAR